MGSKYLDEINDILSKNNIDKLQRTKEIVEVLLKTNESLNSFESFRDEIKTLLIILIDERGFGPSLYHLLGSMEHTIDIIKKYDNPDFISKKDLLELINKTTVTHIITMHCMVMSAYGMNFNGTIEEYGGNYAKEK